jgi:hypothetical protein
MVLFLIIAGLVLALLLVFFTRNAPFRVAADESPGPPAVTSIRELEESEASRDRVRKASIERHEEDGFLLGIVEFDDQGWFWSPEKPDRPGQLGQVLAEIRRISKDRGALILFFAHGWQHNASVEDSHLACFREVLRYLAQGEKEAGRNRAVVGVYLAWRGLSLKIPYVQWLTFWTRKVAAERIGEAQALETLTALEDLDREFQKNGHPDSRLIILGHSFGGTLLYSALANVFVRRMAGELYASAPAADGSAARSNAIVPGFGDLVVLVNPAFEASRYQALLDISRRYRFDDRQTPVLLLVSAANDAATRMYFPVGRLVSTLFQRTRDRFQSRQMTRTAANYKPFVTHTLKPTGAPLATPPRGQEGPCRCETPLRQHLLRKMEADRGRTRKDQMMVEQRTVERFDLTAKQTSPTSELTPKEGVAPHDPILVVTADKRIIDGHNGLFNVRLLDFLLEFVGKTDQKIEAVGPARALK